MFISYPEAEITLPPALSDHGEIGWQWVELSNYGHYFYATINVPVTEGITIGRHLIFCRLDDVLSFIAGARADGKEPEMGLFSPGHMNGSGFYKFGRIKEIWNHRSNNKQMFVMSDCARYYYSTDEDHGILDEELELVASL